LNLAIAAPLGLKPRRKQQLYNFQRLAAMKSHKALRSRTSLDAQISTLVTYWAAPSDWQIATVGEGGDGKDRAKGLKRDKRPSVRTSHGVTGKNGNDACRLVR
jgi:hypothetical protein